MKRNQSSQLFSVAATTPVLGVLLFFAPTIASAQTVPATTISPVTDNATQSVNSTASLTTTATTSAAPTSVAPTNTTTQVTNQTPVMMAQTAPTAPGWVQPAPSNAPVGWVPAPVGQWNPQYVYPVAPQVVSPAPQNGGLTVQVTTQIGLPNQAMPGQVLYPNVQNVAPGLVGAQGGYYPVFPSGVVNPTLPTTPQLPITNGFSDAIVTPALLPLAAQSVWQQIVSSSSQTSTQNVAALQQLIRDYPNFIPAYIQLAQALVSSNRTQEAITVLERGTTLYPNQPELARSLIVALGNSNRWTEAGMAARQFAIRNPNSPVVSEFTKLADESNQLAQSAATSTGTVRPARNSMLGSLLTAGLGYLLLGRGNTNSSPLTGLLTPQSNSTISSPLTDLLTSGTSTTPILSGGNQVTQEFLNRVQLLNDAEVSSYINDVGRRLAQASGQNNFEFFVVRDRDTGAIALPNRKIFVSAGAIANTNSEAELAALMARQMGHSILSHPDQVARRTNLTNTLTRLLPTIGGLVSPQVRDFNNSTVGTLVSGLMGNVSNGLFRPNYTTQMVNQANSTATKLLNDAGYSQGSLVSLNLGDRHSQMKARVQQLLGTTSQPWWSFGR